MEGLYNLLKSVSDNLEFDVEFQQGRASDLNIFSNNNKSVLIWLLPFSASGSFPNHANRLFRNFRIEMAFYQSDKIDSTNADYREILETTDKIALNYLLNINTQIATLDDVVDDIEITNISQLPLIKVTSHIVTGQSLVFNINLPDDFNYCP